MSYEEHLRKRFHEIDLDVEDLYLLEAHQIGYLPDRVPEKEFAAVLWTNPSLKRFFETKHPPIAKYINDVMARYSPMANPQVLAEYSDRLVWEIAEMIIYNKHPDIYDQRADFCWNFDEVTSIVPLENKIVIDAGAGTGKVAFETVKTAHQVFAVEPNSSLRQFMKNKASQIGTTNLYVIDGFLHEIPLPDGFVDVLLTSHAIGWQLEKELREIERVVKKEGFVVHLTGYPADAGDNPVHATLLSKEWHYHCSNYLEKEGLKRKYWKQI
jgi:ubiquinone/menaquinone biosynthesis C-methylase UbiE